MTRAAEQPLSREAIRWLTLLHSGRVTPTDRAALAAWRTQSPAHEEAYAEAEGIWDLASGLEQDAQTGLAHPAEVRPARRRHTYIYAAVAAVLLVLVPPGVPWSNLLADYATGTAARRSVALPDGSRVALDAGSALDIQFDARTRRVVLREGGAYFEVVHDKTGRPFSVTAGGTTVTDLGTAFEVERNRNGGVAVAVGEHAVAVTSSSGAETRLHENQRMLVDAVGRESKPVSIGPSHIAAWRAGRLIAEAEPLGDVAEGLARYRHGWIFVAPDAAQLSVSAVLDLNDPEKALQTLAAAVPIRVRRLTSYLVIVTRD